MESPFRVSFDEAVKTFRQCTIGMQKQEELASRRLAGGVHLRGTTRIAMHDSTGISIGNIEAAVFTAAITDDDFGMICHPMQREQIGQALIETVRLVQNRNDNAELRPVRQGLRHNCYPGLQYSRNNDLQY